MSDLATAAEAMGVPEPLVERSARAWAADSGQSYEDVVTAWAGGQAVTTAPAAAAAEDTPEPEQADETPQPTEEPDTAPTTPAAPPSPAPTAPAPATAPAASNGRPPVLEAPADRPLVSVLGGVGVVLLTVLLGFVFPSVPVAGDEVRSSRIPLTDTAATGRHVYLEAGCASCHTQSVRSVVADAGVGPVSLSDSNQVLGFRRIGPDLSDIGSRLSAEGIAAFVSGSSHPTLALSSDEVDALASYLSQSATSPEDTGEEADDTGGDDTVNDDPGEEGDAEADPEGTEGEETPET